MPKKFKHSYPSKPQSTVHPSLSSSGRQVQQQQQQQAYQHDSASTASVNEILSRLRGAADPRTEPHQDVSPATRPIRLFPPSQHQPAADPTGAAGVAQQFQHQQQHQHQDLLTPRARMIARARLRPVPGPAAPASWSRISRSGSVGTGQTQIQGATIRQTSSANMEPLRTMSQLEEAAAELSRRYDRLPGLLMPAKKSLVYRILRKIALDWHWFVHREGVNLAFMPQHLKKFLLPLLVIYGPGLIQPQEIDLLCYDDEDVEGATGVTEIAHVHAAFLANPVTGHIRGYKDIQHLLFGEEFLRAVKASQQSKDEAHGVPDSWEDDPDASSSSSSSSKHDNYSSQRAGYQLIGSVGTPLKPRFTSLTHLDLAHAPFASWKHLLRDLTPHMRQLTHLSLAFWPTPSLTTNSRNTVLISASGSLDSRTLNWYRDNTSADWTDAIGVIQRLGRDLPLLRWLDFEGCSSQGGWIEALSSSSADTHRHVDWTGTFRGLETLKIGQGTTPQPLRELKSMRDFIENWVIRAMIDLRSDTSIREWIEANCRRTLERIADKMRGKFFFDDLAAKDLWLWLEREARVSETARHIDAVRMQSGLPPRSLDVVCSERQPWTDTLLRHERRGTDVDEQLRDGLEIFKRIVPRDQIASVVFLMKEFRVPRNMRK